MLYLMLLIAAATMPLGFAFGRTIAHCSRRRIAPMRRALG
jgi:hypothetical protein